MFWLSLGLRWCVDFFQALGCRDKARGTSAVVTVVGWCSFKLRSPSYPKLLVMLSYLYLMLSQFYSFLSYIIYTLSYVTLLDSCWSFACYHVTHQPGSYQTSLPSRCTSKTNEDHKNTSRKEVKNSQELSLRHRKIALLLQGIHFCTPVVPVQKPVMLQIAASEWLGVVVLAGGFGRVFRCLGAGLQVKS